MWHIIQPRKKLFVVRAVWSKTVTSLSETVRSALTLLVGELIAFKV